MAGLQHLSLSILIQVLDYLPVTELIKCSAINRPLHQKASAILRRLMYKLKWQLETTEPPVSVYVETYSKYLATYCLKTNTRRTFKHVPAVHKVVTAFNNIAVLAHSGQVYLINPDFSSWNEHLCSSEATHVATSQDSIAIKTTDGLLTLVKYGVDRQEFETYSVSVEDLTSLCCTNELLIGTARGKVFSWQGAEMQAIEMSPENSSPIKDIKSGTDFSLILTNDGRVYSLHMRSTTAVVIKQLKKNISRIAVGRGHCLMLQRKEYPPLEDWSCEVLCQWLEEQDFSELRPLVFNSRITGADLENADQYLVDTLGITEVDKRWRIKALLDQALSGFIDSEFELLGLGASHSGQLGIKAKLLKQPSKIPAPPLQKNETVIDIACSTKCSVVLTSSGRILGIGECSGEDGGWTDLTEKFHDPSQTKAYSITSGFTTVAVVVGLKRRSKVQRSRFKGADKILSRIQWDPMLNPDDFTLGFEDRFLGVIELPVREFLPRDIPSHRIRYFKRLGQLVWDRRSKVDII